jgi:hypothetical protein
VNKRLRRNEFLCPVAILPLFAPVPLSSAQREDLVVLEVALPVLLSGPAPAPIVRLDGTQVIPTGVAMLAHNPGLGLLKDHPRCKPHGHVAYEIRNGIHRPVPARPGRQERADRAISPHMAAIREIDPRDPAPRIVAAAGIVEPGFERPEEAFRLNPVYPGMRAVSLPACREMAEFAASDCVDRPVVMNVVEEIE